MEQIGISYATMVNGSFCSTKADPGDVDLCLMLDAAEANALGSAEQDQLRALVAGPNCKPEYLCDAYPAIVYPMQDPRFAVTVNQISYWTRVFGIDRQGNQKAFLLITERGTL